MSTRDILVSLGSILLVAVLVFHVSDPFQYEEAATIGARAQNFEELSDEFAQLAQEKGAVYAFEVLRRAELPPNTDMHLLGHRVGDELYKQKGIESITNCTQDFRNACSHSIVIGALNEFGERALPDIREACRKAPGGSGAYTMCFHGLGHGVFAYYQYQFPETVAFCETTGTEEYGKREAIECIGGAVMELMGGGGHDTNFWLLARERYLENKEPLALCLGEFIPEHARELCFIYLTPHLWELAGIEFGSPEPEKFSTAFRFCDLVPSGRSDLRDACIAGFGKEFVPLAGARDIRRITEFTDDEFKTALKWCSYAGTHSATCMTEALNSIFWGGENDPSASLRFCRLADEAGMGASCYERLAANITQYLPDSLAGLCASFPDEFREHCAIEREL